MSKNVSLPFSLLDAEKIAADYGTPVYVYDESGIRATARKLQKAFSWDKTYKNYFAIKATPTPAILKILQEEGMGFDCSSRAELTIMQKMGVAGKDIFYTSNNTPKEDFEFAVHLGATINIDDLTQVPVFLEALGGMQYAKVALRYNPGSLKEGNAIIGKPTEAKYGMDLPGLVAAFELLKKADIQEMGLHTMVASNELNESYFAETTRLLLEAVDYVEAKAQVSLKFINLGGGFGLNYKIDQEELDLSVLAAEIKDVIRKKNRIDLALFTENGRFITGPHGYLVSRVRYVMNKHKTYVGLDASMHNLMRPGMYGAFHYITVLGVKSGEEHVYDVVGSLCENNDKFAIDRLLPEVEPGNLIVIHDAGAHGHSMGFNYNGLLRSAEVLLEANGQTRLIRRAETVDDYLSTIVWE